MAWSPASEPTERTLRVPPEPNGTKIRINEFFPGYINELGNQSPVHRTESIDYGIVVAGEMEAWLDSGEKRPLKATMGRPKYSVGSSASIRPPVHAQSAGDQNTSSSFGNQFCEATKPVRLPISTHKQVHPHQLL